MKKLTWILFGFISLFYIDQCGPYGNNFASAAQVKTPPTQSLCNLAPTQCPTESSKCPGNKKVSAEKPPCLIFSSDESNEIELLCSKKNMNMSSAIPRKDVRLLIRNKTGKERTLLPCSWNSLFCSFRLNEMEYFKNDLLLQVKSGDKWTLQKKLN